MTRAAVLLAVADFSVRPGDYRTVNLAFVTGNGVVGVGVAMTASIDGLFVGPTFQSVNR